MDNKKDILGMYKNIAKYAIDIIYDMNQEVGEEEVEESNSVSPWTLNRVPKLFNSIKKEMKEIDFTEFNQDELKALGFSFWDDENHLMLAPRWVFLIDMDARFGSTAWVFTKSQLRDHKLESIINESE